MRPGTGAVWRIRQASGWTPPVAIDWAVAPTRALDESQAPLYRWFPDGQLNTCHNALDRHVDAGRGEPARACVRQSGHRLQGIVHLSRAA